MQKILPLIPYGASVISNYLSVINEKGQWTYYHACFPIFSHSENDIRTFRMITSSFLCQGICRNVDIERIFNVSKTSVIRNKNKFEREGPDSFFKEKKTGGSGRIITKKIISKAEELLFQGFTRTETAEKLGVKYSTLSKAVQDGRIKEGNNVSHGINKSHRSLVDHNAADGMGVACTRTLDRIMASVNSSSISKTCFERCDDVTNAGVLTTLPALISNGLYDYTEEVFPEFTGYYTVTQILTLMAFMALSRIKTPEQLRYQPSGELGKLFGLDRIPEVRCFREKIAELSQDNLPEKWGALLSNKWMEDNPEFSGILYIDGNVRTYGGKEKIPKKYVSRERLCQRGFMDFWVNDMIGQPFFVVRKTVNPGMLKTLKDDIVPRLLEDIPNQPTKKELEEDPYLYRFILVFDREGYSPVFFKKMWKKHRIACMTYNKYPGEDWDESEFEETEVIHPNKEKSLMKLAERGRYIGSKKNGLWVKEVRKLTKNKHQTSIVCTIFNRTISFIAAFMFARWCQELFFKYMREHYKFHLMNCYAKKELPDTEKIISSKWRQLEKRKNSINGKLKTRKSRFGDLTLHPTCETNEKKYIEWQKTKEELAEEIHLLETKLEMTKEEQDKQEKYIKISELPEDEYFKEPEPNIKNFTDTIKMISYRTETCMAGIIMKECGTLGAARALLRDVFSSEADLIPDPSKKTLTVRLHNLSTRAMDQKLDVLLEFLNKTKSKYPGTNLVLNYQRIGKGVICTSAR